MKIIDNVKNGNLLGYTILPLKGIKNNLQRYGRVSGLPNVYIHNSTVRVYVTELLLKGRTDLNEFTCMRLSDALGGLVSLISPAGGAAVGI